MSVRRLPPLSGLEAFMSVARMGSLKAAAVDLSLSTPALSRRLQGLERAIGATLFDRHHQTLQLSETGKALFETLSPALDSVVAAIEQAVGERRLPRLRLNVLPLFAAQRLFPRLRELRALHPQLHIDIETLAHGDTRLGDGVDAAIALLREPDEAHYAVKLQQDFVFPLAARHLVEGPERLRGPDDLKRYPILIHREMPETFELWKAAIGRPDLEVGGIDYFDSGQLILEAAAQGVGVAFMLGQHLSDSQDKRIMRLFDYDIESPYCYYFVCRPRALANPAVRLFRDWLISTDI